MLTDTGKSGVFTLILAAVLVALSVGGAAAAPSFQISIADGLVDEPVDGRIILAISKTPEFDVGEVEGGAQLFGVTVDAMGRGGRATIDGTTKGYPLANLSEVPPGQYYVKAYLHRYTTFHRADGHVVKLPMDQGEGQVWHISPGNLVSEPIEVAIGAVRSKTHKLELSEVLPPIDPPAETEWVKSLEIESALVSEFWGRPMKIGARVLLPKGFDAHPDAKYPVVIQHGHFDRRAPGYFWAPGDDLSDYSEGNIAEGKALYDAWVSEDFPRFLLVTIQHPTPYYDDSYAVNSQNHGPYGDALTQELIPAIERAFRGIGAPFARLLTGGSTGGWETVAQQVWYPDFFGGAWAFYPDQLDFHYYQLADLYEGENAYYRQFGWLKTALPSMRDVDGRPRFTMANENHYEEVIGTRYRSGGQWAAWASTFAPVAEDGYPAALWEPWTGEINREAADWAIEHYDVTKYLRDNWSEVGPKLVGKLNIFMGDRDNFYLEQATYLLEAFMAETENPHYPGRFEYSRFGNHGWTPWRESGDIPGLYREMAEHVKASAPDGHDPAEWNYEE